MAETELEARVAAAMKAEGRSCALPGERLYDRPLQASFVLSAKCRSRRPETSRAP
jgi:hypothetical protein